MATVDIPLRQREINKEPQRGRALLVEFGDIVPRGGDSLPHRFEDRILFLAAVTASPTVSKTGFSQLRSVADTAPAQAVTRRTVQR